MLKTREEAKEQIAKIKSSKERIVKTGATLPIRKGQVFDVYKVDIDLLVPNFLNDRITWRTLEYEAANNIKLSSENETDVDYVYETIWQETQSENRKTMEDLATKGQQVDGVITNDGRIIDGNRRVTILRKLFNGDAKKFNRSVDDFRFFNCIILDEDISDNEIMALETQIQIGTDEKVKYNRICLYLKVENLRKANYNDEQIRSLMNLKSVNEVKEFKEVFLLMNQYLNTIGKSHYYTLLDELEDQFIATNRVFKKLDNETYSTADDWDYSKEDVANFKEVCYDYLRSKFEGKKYRDVLIGRPNKSNGIFIKKSVWDDFYANHQKIVDDNNPQNEDDWRILGKKQFNQNLDFAVDRLKDTLVDRNVSSIIDTIENKLHSLEGLLNDIDDIDAEDLERLHDIEKKIWKIYNSYKNN